MKNFFSLLLVCFFTASLSLHANVQPIFEDDHDSNDCIWEGHTFAIEEEADEEELNESSPYLPHLPLPSRQPLFEEEGQDETQLSFSYSRWSRYKTNFGMEKLYIRFPHSPAITQSNTLLTAYAYDHAVMYSMAGYYPPVGNIDPNVWFDEILYSLNTYPYSLISHTFFQVSNGDWVMDYVAHDYAQNLLIKSRAIVTPFNGYILQCVKPNGVKDHFPYFLDHFWIKCECDH